MQIKSFARLLVPVVTLWLAPATAEEQLEQKTIVVKGNQGLPKTLYIAPWKRVGTPLKSDELKGEIEEEKDPLEPEKFQRNLELKRQGYSTE